MESYDDMYPVPWPAIEHALRTFGGWSRIFSMSTETYEIKNVVLYERDPGFWIEWAKVRAEEKFREEVREAYREFVREHGRVRPRAELEKLLARALLKEGWQPNLKEIRKEIRNHKSKKREDILCLRKSQQRKARRKRRK